MELLDTEESSDPRQGAVAMARHIKMKFFAFTLHLEGMDEIQRATKSPEHADSMVALIGSTALNRMEKDDAETRATKMHRCERMQLSLYKLLEYWAAEEANDCPALAACKIIDIYINVKHRRRDTATAKRELPVIMIGNWQNMHKMKYGVHFRPNFAWLWCIAFNLGPWWFDMFYVERQHKRVKRQVEPVKNTSKFDGTVLQRFLDDQMSSLQTFDVEKPNYGLSERRVPSMLNGHPASMADSLTWQGVAIHVDDLVVRAQSRTAVGVVVAFFQHESDLLLEVEVPAPIALRGRGKDIHARVIVERTRPPARGKLQVQVDGDEGALAS